MSKVQEILDEKAKDLCAQLGSLQLQKKQVVARKKQIEDAERSVEAELSALNSIAPELQKMEEEVKQETKGTANE